MTACPPSAVRSWTCPDLFVDAERFARRLKSRYGEMLGADTCVARARDGERPQVHMRVTPQKAHRRGLAASR